MIGADAAVATAGRGAGRWECGICWHVYDPAVGDPQAQVPAGTPFAGLPAGWCCPRCDGPREKFLALADRGDSRDQPAHGPADAGGPPVLTGAALAARLAALTATYRQIGDSRMRDLPVYNPALAVDAVGFRPWTGASGAGAIGIVITPWFMNAVLLPAEPGGWDTMADGVKRLLALPSGSYEFVAGALAGVGTVLSCSLFSPMAEFDDPAVARLVAETALTALLTPEGESPAIAPAEPAATPAGVSRRRLLRGGLS